jgi:hypothetical protein
VEELLSILDGHQACIISELEPFIDAEKQPGVLAHVMSIMGNLDRVLEIVTSSVSIPGFS